MTAREMFKELGYEYEFYGIFIKYSKIMIDENNKYLLYNCVFWFDFKNYSSFIINLEDFSKDVLYIDNPTFKAIQQQMKELGWLE